MSNDNLIEYDNNYGPVMNLRISNKNNLKFDSKGNLLTYKGLKPAIIHQYVRVHSIVSMVKRKYTSQAAREASFQGCPCQTHTD